MMMVGRKFSATGSYRFGFNGKENDNEVKGEGNVQDYGMRVYDLRLGRFFSVDPLTSKFPFYTPYQFAGNNPIPNSDLDGTEPENKNGVNDGDIVPDKDGRNWILKNGDWARTEKEQMDEIIIKTYASTYHQPLGDFVERFYDQNVDAIRIQVGKDLVELLAKRINLPDPSIGLPSAEDIAKELTKQFAGDRQLRNQFYGAMYAMVKHRNDPVAMGISGAAIIHPSIAVAYNLVFKPIINSSLLEHNIGIIQGLDQRWNDTRIFTLSFKNSKRTMEITGVDHLHCITVTRAQFIQIMNDKIFFPEVYSQLLIPSIVDKQQLMAETQGDEPAYYIYYNDIYKKGFLHIKEVGIAPIFPKIRK